ncbi:retropepsin-like aspartic protease family protein [Sphingomonas jaspsi]|uniref:retropepsin-like aspartic protease family protein n=1 Tax=Sphingomonas jaspsi TaxID=392409 RepID=UPI000A0799E8|nr:TIGR02281 family clan AA aspartic protease [Sphingomonas jaspsi]
MSDADGPYLLTTLLCLVLVGSGLAARRLPLAQTAKMALAWIGIFTLVFGLLSFRSEFTMVGQRMKSELLGTSTVEGGEVRVQMAEDGHFWTNATVNGKDVRFLIDSGATTTTISGELADQLGIEGTTRKALVETANGTIGMRLADADLKVGNIERPGLGVMINEQDSANVIGMNFLSSLTSWRVEGRQLIMKP